MFPSTFPIPVAAKHPRPPRPAVQWATAEDSKVYEDLERLMQTKRPFLDPNINITRVARQLNVPARSVSNAVNRVSAQNFSQYVNRLRVSEVCSLLTDTNRPITEIMFEAGFQTKSTFNREFLAAVGRSPSGYRKDAIQSKR
jgi:AraC-like DNA-binding protein